MGVPLRTSASPKTHVGIPWEKGNVPSIGSHSQRYSALLLKLLPSSPKKPWFGNDFFYGIAYEIIYRDIGYS